MLTRKKLRAELKELITPVIQHLMVLPDIKTAPETFRFQHRDEEVEVRFILEMDDLVVYINGWYGEIVAFRISPQNFADIKLHDESWIVERFVQINTLLINRIFKSVNAVH